MATLAEMLRQTGYAKDGQLQAPTPTQPNLSTMSADYIRQLPQKFNENQAEQMALLARAFPDDTLKNADTKAMAEMAMQTPFNALTAFHGTPHKILGKFDISKVGTGEGAQAYGHGMYFAENPAVAKEYQKMLRGPESTAQHYLDLYKTPESAISAIQYEIKPNLTAEAKKHSLDAIEVLKSGKELKGNLYKVDIPDEYIPNMLQWDKPLSQQPKSVQKALAKIDPDLYSKKGMDYDPEELGQMIYQRLSQIDMNKNGPFTGASRNVSNMLNEQGIKGIRYNDAGSRGVDGGTSNFVVFEPSNVKILEENSKPVTRKKLIQEQVNKLD
jgi:hypothetical protein